MNQATNVTPDILVTSDVLARYKISRSTLYFWSTPSRMPAYFSQPFPKPKINGCPKRWRFSDLIEWEDKVGIKPEGDQSGFQDGSATPPTSDADRPCSHAGYNEP